MKIFFLITTLVCSLLAFHALAASECKVLVVVGMEDERTIAAGTDNDESIEIVVGTANAKILSERLQAINVNSIKAVFSFGVAGGLDPALKPGELLLSEQVLSQVRDDRGHTMDVNWPVDSNLLLAATFHAGKMQQKFHKGIFFGTNTEARDQPQNAEHDLRKITGADIIDNETHIAAQYATEHGLPFLSIRAVSDLVTESLPPAALLPLDEDGSPDGWAIAKSLLMNPLQIPSLIKIIFNYHKALNTLQQFREQVGFEKIAAGSGVQCGLSSR